MLGAIIGDMVGHALEFGFVKKYDFPFFSEKSYPTDDTYMTLAVANALLHCRYDRMNIEKLKRSVETEMKYIAHMHPDTQWGSGFEKFVFENAPAWNSWGNGAAMRISPVGWIANSEEEVNFFAKIITEVSHLHPEAVRGAQATAMCVYLARIGKDKDYIRDYIADNYYPRIRTMKYDAIWKLYEADEGGKYLSCQGSVPESIVAFLDSTDFEDAIRKAVQYGADTDTQGSETV